MADFDDFDFEEYAQRGMYVPPIENAAEMSDWEYVKLPFNSNPGIVWLTRIPPKAFKQTDLALSDAVGFLASLAWVRRVDGEKAKLLFSPGDAVMLDANALNAGWEIPHSTNALYTGLYANRNIKAVAAENILYRIRKELCEANHERIAAEKAANKKTLQDTQRELANRNSPEKEKD